MNESFSMPSYFPPPGDGWERIGPARAGFDEGRLAQAVAFAEAHESPWPRSMYVDEGRYIGGVDLQEEPPFDEVLGEVRPRGGPAGLILRGGRIAAEWGDTARADMTFSIAKSYLAVLAGIAVARGLIRSVDDPVRGYALDQSFEAPQNRTITWRHLLQQTSEWEGTLWDKPDLADRNRHVGPGAAARKKGTHRDLQPPGAFWEYNDVRVNLLSFALMQVFRRPLPEVLREAVMDPIGASSTWAWRGYRNSRFEIDGRMMESVSGGAHWGGGLFISTRDHARFGYLVHRRGRWGELRLVPECWIAALRTPCPIKPIYGFMWWLNTGRQMYPSAPESSIFCLGMGTNLIWLDDALDLVVIARWIARDHVDGLIGKIMGSLEASQRAP
jgi:CubicO group peptidase (beta-lactamase class C family)